MFVKPGLSASPWAILARWPILEAEASLIAFDLLTRQTALLQVGSVTMIPGAGENRADHEGRLPVPGSPTDRVQFRPGGRETMGVRGTLDRWPLID